ncbi:MAG: hypothetical protein ABJN69_13085 [Hellea sp.]
MIKAILGGTFGYVQAGLLILIGGALLWLWGDYKAAKKTALRLESEIAALTSTLQSKDGIIASLGRSAGRRSHNNTHSKELANDIQNAKDGEACVHSEPIRIVLDGLRLRPKQDAPNIAAQPVPVFAGADPAAPK